MIRSRDATALSSRKSIRILFIRDNAYDLSIWYEPAGARVDEGLEVGAGAGNEDGEFGELGHLGVSSGKHL